MNNPAFFEIQADDPVRAANFYQTLFGWKFTKQEGLPIDYWQIETEGIRGGLLGRPAPAGEQMGTNAFTCSMQVENYDAMSSAILQNGGQIALEKFPVPGKCWQGYFLDTEGNTFGLFEVDEQAGL